MPSCTHLTEILHGADSGQMLKCFIVNQIIVDLDGDKGEITDEKGTRGQTGPRT